MRIILLLFLQLLVAAPVFSQTKTAGPKTIPGIRIKSLTDAYFVSADRSIAVLQDYTTFTFVDVEKGTVREVPREYRELSPDCRYSFAIGHLDVWMPEGIWARKYKFLMRAINGGASDTLVSDYYYFGMDAQRRIIATKPILTADKKRIFCFLGLYAIDHKTQQPLATLRTDTIYQPGRFGFGSFGGEWSGGAPEKWSLQSSFLVIRAGTKRLQVFPFNSTKVVTIHFEGHGDDRFEPELTDDQYVYMHSTGFRDGGDFSAYSVHTGELAARHIFPKAEPYQMVFGIGGQRLYRYDRATSMLYAEEAVNGSFVARDSFKIQGPPLSPSQIWVMQVCKGPSLLFTPLNLEKAEAGGPEANTAMLVQLPSGKAKLRITPFYNRSETVAMQQAADQKAFNEKSARNNLERERQQKVSRDERCKASWNNDKFRKGLTKQYDGAYVILESYDCAKDEFRFYVPRQPEDWDEKSTKPGWRTADGEQFRYAVSSTSKQYHTCTECDGQGKVLRTTTTTRTKELPWGYFSGIETTSTRTTTKEEVKMCLRCGGRGIVLE